MLVTKAQTKDITIALPKGRVLEAVRAYFKPIGIIPEKAFDDTNSRKLSFTTNIKNLNLIRARSFDVATLVAFGAAQFGILGSDVIEECQYDELFSPVNLNIAKCRLSLAKPLQKQTFSGHSHQMRIATKYPITTKNYFANRAIQVQCIKLHGAIELAPSLGIADYIVDMVSSGATLKANHLREITKIADVSTRLIVNRNSARAMPGLINPWIQRFRDVANNSTILETHNHEKS